MMTGNLSKNFHDVGIGPFSKILAVKAISVVAIHLREEDFMRFINVVAL